jgi:hypothetical protein
MEEGNRGAGTEGKEQEESAHVEKREQWVSGGRVMKEESNMERAR